MSWAVMAVLAVVWTTFLVPSVLRARRRREDALAAAPVSDRVVIERRGARWVPPLLALGGAALGVAAVVQVEPGGLVAGAVLLAIGIVTWRHRGDGPLAIADAEAGREGPAGHRMVPRALTTAGLALRGSGTVDG